MGVSFKWVGPPDDVRASSVTIWIAGGTAPSGGDPQKPQVAITGAIPQTLKHPNQINLTWSSYSYNDGNILWGPASNPRAWTVSIKPSGAKYSGAWTTDRPLTPRAGYSFTVQVKNSLTTNRWIETTMAAQCVANFHSVRQFLIASNVKGPSLRNAIGHGGSLRQIMGI